MPDDWRKPKRQGAQSEETSSKETPSKEMPNKIEASFNEAISTAEQLSELVSAVGTQIFNKVSSSALKTTEAASEAAAQSAHTVVEQATETVGHRLHPIAENPATEYVAVRVGVRRHGGDADEGGAVRHRQDAWHEGSFHDH